MGKDFKEGPLEPERFVDEDGNHVHVSKDRRGIVAAREYHVRARKRKIEGGKNAGPDGLPQK